MLLESFFATNLATGIGMGAMTLKMHQLISIFA
jgi:hypothetical protein